MSRQQSQSRFERGNDLVVMKFGGTSVEDVAAVRRLVQIVRTRSDTEIIVVVSALAGVTDQLGDAGHAAAEGRLGSALATVRNIYVRHEAIADDLVGGPASRDLERDLRSEFRELESMLHSLDESRKLAIAAQDRLLGFGERLSSTLVSACLCADGVKASHVDAHDCIVTDACHSHASPVWDETRQRLQDALTPLLEAGQVPVLGGFIASTSDGVPTTLGRGGSDFTASIVGAALDACRIEIWTDVDGIMTADPKICPDARLVRRMSFEEAAELAHFGAKVLHPATLAPAMRENIPLHVLNSRNPQGEGTQIGGHARGENPVSAISAKRKVVAVEIESTRGVGAEVLHRVCAAFDKHGCPVDVIAASIGQLWLMVSSTAALPAIAAELRDAAQVRWENHQGLVCLVGEGIRRQPEVTSRVFAAVSDLNVRVMCQGASDRTISFLVEESKVEESVRRLHGLFFPVAREAARDWGGISTAFCQAG